MRRIDANAIRDEVLNDNTYDNDTVNYYLGLIDAAPTIEPKRGEWIPVSKRLPKRGEVYLVANGSTIKTAYLDGGYTWVDSANYILRYVTHWMLLPEPPCGADMREVEK